MRVSDTERQRVIEELRRHCAAGRIDVDEYAERIERALAATTLADLDQVTGDLPIVRIADPRGSSRDRRREASLVGAAQFGNWSPVTSRLAGSLVVVLTVGVIVAAILLVVLGSWAWGAVLIAGWLVGLLQSAAAARRRQPGT
jgi:Flp pilus assembly protein TadB